MSTVLSLYRGVMKVAAQDLRTMAQIASDVAQKHKLTVEDLKAATRARRIAWPRQEAMAAMYATGRYTTVQIGRFLGDRDHTTILHGIRRHAERFSADAASCRITPDLALEAVS